MLVIAAEPPRQAQVLALLAASDAESAARYPEASRHGVGVDVLERAECRFLVARDDGAAVGCGALWLAGDGEAEIKRLFVTAPFRCRGVARRILATLEDLARAEGVAVLRLETGVASHAALALYHRVGFCDGERFAPYGPDPLSVFLQKRLA